MKKTCPVCLSNTSKKSFYAQDIHGTVTLSKEKFLYIQCGVCDAIYLTDKKISQAFYKKYYSNSYYRNNGTGNFISDFLTVFANTIKATYVKKSQTNTNVHILDIGAGDLKFLESLGSIYKKTAIDIQFYKKNKDIKLINGDIGKISLSKKYDYITMWHFLEHYPEPITLFRKLSKSVTKNGYVIFSMPNTNSFGYTVAKEKWFHFDAPRHVVLYNKKTVEHLAESTGFTLIDTKNLWYEFPTDILHSIKSANLFLLPLLVIFYPFVKYMSHETICYVFQKK